MNEIVIRIEGLDRLVEVLQILANSQIGGEKPKNPQPQMPAMQTVPAAAPTMPGVPTLQIAAPGQIPLAPGAPMPTSVPAPAQQPVVPVQPPVVPTQQPAADPQPVPAAPAQQIPTTAAPEQYSFDQLAVALSNVCTMPGGQPKVHALLQQFGVNALFDLPKDQYGNFATALRGIGGVI